MMDNEECWVLMGGIGNWFFHAKYDRYTIGQPAQVAFDPEYIWENRDSVVGWVHSHPHWKAYPSSTDDITMRSQVASIGKPLLCCIEGTDCFRAFWYLDDENDPVEVKILRIGKKIYGLKPNKEKLLGILSHLIPPMERYVIAIKREKWGTVLLADVLKPLNSLDGVRIIGNITGRRTIIEVSPEALSKVKRHCSEVCNIEHIIQHVFQGQKIKK